MVEKIIVNPSEVRGLGDIVSPKSTSDFGLYGEDYKIVESTDTVYGTEESVFEMKSIYTLSFGSESYTTSSSSLPVQVTVLNGTTPVVTGTVTVTGAGGSGSGTLIIGGGGVVNITVTGISGSGTLTATYKNAKATAPITYEPVSYSLAFSQDTYTTGFLGDVTVYVTLKDNGVAMSGETITLSYKMSGTNMTTTATTNSSGVASHYFDEFEVDPGTVTATYQGVTAACTIVYG